MSSWFPKKVPIQLEIERFSSVQSTEPTQKYSSKDVDLIRRLIQGFELIPTDGSENKPIENSVSRIRMTFRFQLGTREIELVGGRLKTPAEGFNAQISPIEKATTQQILNLLSVRTSTPAKKVAGGKIVTDKCEIIFLSTKSERNNQPGLPTIGPTQTDFFEIRQSGKVVHTFSISSGQTPPQPKVVIIDQTAYVVSTAKSPTGEQVPTGHFEVRTRPAEHFELQSHEHTERLGVE